MFKFIKQYAEKIDHVQVYPLCSLFVFFLFFVGLLLYVKKMDKNTISTLANIPFDEEDKSTITL